jgi:hypothetical protein
VTPGSTFWTARTAFPHPVSIRYTGNSTAHIYSTRQHHLLAAIHSYHQELTANTAKLNPAKRPRLDQPDLSSTMSAPNTIQTASGEIEPPPTDLITLTRHILSQQAALGERASGDLTMLLIGIQVSIAPYRSGLTSSCAALSWLTCHR